MLTLLLAFAGFACLDALNVLNIGVATAIVYASRLERRSALPGGLSFITGLFVALFTFGVATVLGVRSLTDVSAGSDITPSTRYWAQLIIGILLIAFASLTWFSEPVTPPWIRSIARRHPWLLALVGLALGFAEAPTSVPYLSALAMLASRHPLPGMWLLLVVGYGVIATLPSLLILVLSTRRSPDARRVQRALVRTVTRHGPIAIRIIFLCLGAVLIANALVHHNAMWSH
ncbi:GAP family protein [Mycobacterium sp. NPDC050853]|uniref:GAP family protein n=1 Tax=Mycobacterium sp. NPDC050853 TaxID=3155160 RepID=UPI0033D209E6